MNNRTRTQPIKAGIGMEDDYVFDFWCRERGSLWTRHHMDKSFLGQSNIHVFLNIFIATSHDLDVPLNPVESSLSGRVCMGMPRWSFNFSKGRGCLFFSFPFFRCWNSFFRFIFRMTKKSGRRENKRKKVKNFSGSNHPGNLDICDLKEGNVRQVFIWPYRKQDNSRVDIIKPTKILEHAIAETHVISRFTTKKPILFRLRPQRAIACLPCHVPIVPGRGEGSWAGITPIADWSRFEKTQRRGHWWCIEIGQRQLRFEGRGNGIAVSRSQSSAASVMPLAHSSANTHNSWYRTQGIGMKQ